MSFNTLFCREFLEMGNMEKTPVNIFRNIFTQVTISRNTNTQLHTLKKTVLVTKEIIPSLIYRLHQTDNMNIKKGHIVSVQR